MLCKFFQIQAETDARADVKHEISFNRPNEQNSPDWELLKCSEIQQ